MMSTAPGTWQGGPSTKQKEQSQFYNFKHNEPWIHILSYHDQIYY